MGEHGLPQALTCRLRIQGSERTPELVLVQLLQQLLSAWSLQWPEEGWGDAGTSYS